MRLRILTDLFRQKFVCKTLKYTEYSCGFTPFSDEKSFVRLSCRFMRYCHKKTEHAANSELWSCRMFLFQKIGKLSEQLRKQPVAALHYSADLLRRGVIIVNAADGAAALTGSICNGL